MTNLIHQTHEFPPLIDKESKILILGSFPSVKSREHSFFYMHPQNRFWKVLGALFNVDAYSMNIEEKKDFIISHHIGLYDVIEECDIIGSSDASIRNVTPIDLKKILIEYPNIKSIGVNEKKASSLFKKYLEKDCGGISIYHLPATSPANAKTSLEELIKEYSKLFQK
jgi:hypoxanthine-DNA glycosylase